MNTPSLQRIIATLLASVLTGNPVGAQRHSTQSASLTPEGTKDGMDVWLRRLVGQYRLEGMVHLPLNGPCGTVYPVSACEPVTGAADCIGVGVSPGVQCVLRVEWPKLTEILPVANGTPGATPYLNPAMVLFGIDPGSSSLNYLLVDNKGLAEGGLGTLSGNSAVFNTTCVNVHRTCRRTLRIEARPDTNVLHVSIDVERGYLPQRESSIVLTMRRVTTTRDGAPPPSPRGQR